MDLDNLWEFLENREKFSRSCTVMDVDDDIDLDFFDCVDDLNSPTQELDEGFLNRVCKKVSTAFFGQYGLISHQINSYNHFVKHGIQQLFDSIGEIKIDGDCRHATLKFGKVILDQPTFFNNAKECLDLFPRHARLQNMTYSCKIRVETHLQVHTEGLSRSEYDKVIIGQLPVMVNSNLCWMKTLEKRDCEFDQGGYFIIKGAEKTFIAQEQICLKRLWVSKRPTWNIVYRSVAKKRKVFVKLVPRFEHLVGGEMILKVYFCGTEVPIWLLFFALGAPNDREVVKLIDLDIEDCDIANILTASIEVADKEFEGFRNGGNAIEHINELMKRCNSPPTESVEECINNSLFPNLKTLRQKACFLAYMVRCLLEAYKGRRRVDNRDDLRNKRLELASELLERELGVHLKHLERRMVKAIQRNFIRNEEVRSIEHYLDASIVTNGLCRAFSTGAWVHPYKWRERTCNVVASLRRTNPLQTAGDLRKTRQQVPYIGKVGGARHPHPSHWGRLCFLSTPDGENCGLVKNLASLGLVTTTVVQQQGLVQKFHECGMEKLSDNTTFLLHGKHRVFLDGDWVGMCRDSSSFVAKLRRKRRRKEVPHEIEIKRDRHHGEVRIFADSGRILRPLLVVKNLYKINDLKGDVRFQSLLDCGVVELIGPEEEEDIRVAWGIKYLFKPELEEPPLTYTHCELDSSFLLGLSCGLIPFANHDHARRVLYQSEKHSQQAIGYSSTNPCIRVDTNSHQLYYPQRPLFRTLLSDCLGKSSFSLHHRGMLPRPEFFNGQCAIVAVNVHLGYNQEDSLVMNRASLERGMFRSEHVRSYEAEVENSEGAGKKKKVDKLVSFGKVGDVAKLDEDGFPYIGANLEHGDIVIGKNGGSGFDQSIKLKHTEKGVVHKVVLSSNDGGKNFASVSLRQVRTPRLGDKFSSMHGQKGVLGLLDSQENFPFTRQGIVPDVVINPHAFPSRQTPGQLLEAALGKGIALGGGLKYATPFSTPSMEDVSAQLHRLGFSRWGNERVYNGCTGEVVDSLTFMGPTFYQRLAHMAEDKVKFRNKGPVHPFTRQPVADKKRFGGLKFGEMERDCLIAHGAAANLHERLFNLSDPSQMHICRKCRNMANVIQRPGFGRGPYCRVCESMEDVVKVNVPYGAKLLTQELFSMGISLKFDTELC